MNSGLDDAERKPFPGGGMDAPLARKVAAALRVARFDDARRHLFLCVGPDCCQPEEGLATWDYIKRRVRECDVPLMRTKAACLRICCGGPWLVVYPDGIWYGGVTAERFERILQEHLLDNRPVTEWVAAERKL